MTDKRVKLTPENKRFILDSHHLSHSVLARMFGVSRQRVHQLRIVNGIEDYIGRKNT